METERLPLNDSLLQCAAKTHPKPALREASELSLINRPTQESCKHNHYCGSCRENVVSGMERVGEQGVECLVSLCSGDRRVWDGLYEGALQSYSQAG